MKRQGGAPLPAGLSPSGDRLQGGLAITPFLQYRAENGIDVKLRVFMKNAEEHRSLRFDVPVDGAFIPVQILRPAQNYEEKKRVFIPH